MIEEKGVKGFCGCDGSRVGGRYGGGRTARWCGGARGGGLMRWRRWQLAIVYSNIKLNYALRLRRETRFKLILKEGLSSIPCTLSDSVSMLYNSNIH